MNLELVKENSAITTRTAPTKKYGVWRTCICRRENARNYRASRRADRQLRPYVALYGRLKKLGSRWKVMDTYIARTVIDVVLMQEETYLA